MTVYVALVVAKDFFLERTECMFALFPCKRSTAVERCSCDPRNLVVDGREGAGGAPSFDLIAAAYPL